MGWKARHAAAIILQLLSHCYSDSLFTPLCLSVCPSEYVYQGETGQACDGRGARGLQEQGDSGGCWHGGHGLCHQHPPEGEIHGIQMVYTVPMNVSSRVLPGH